MHTTDGPPQPRFPLSMGPFDAPLTTQQREGIDRFLADLRAAKIDLVHIANERMEVVHALVPPGRA